MYAAYATSNAGAQAYAKVGMETSAMNSSQLQLMLMLFDGAKTAITMARHHMAKAEIVAKGRAISKAINIVENGLKVALESDALDPAEVKLVENLSDLYSFISNRLLLANRRNDPALLDEAGQLLDGLSSSWRDLDSQKQKLALVASNATAAGHLSTGA